MPSERDAGLLALQQGNSAAAVPLLETACQQNPGDFDAFLFLGAAYGQVGRQMDAINTITRAVQLQPANAQARYNLAVAMEQGGYRDQAVTALSQALTLQPDYPKAQESLRRLQGGDAPAPAAALDPKSNPSVTPAESGLSQAPETGYSASLPANAAPPSTAPSFSQPETGMAILPQIGFGQLDDEPPPSPQSAYGQPLANDASPMMGPGYNPSPAPVYGQPLYGAPPAQMPADSPYGQQPPANPYSVPPPAASPYGAPSPAPSPYPAPPSAVSSYAAPAPAASPYGAPASGSYEAPATSSYGSLQTPGPQGVYGQTSPYGEKPRRAIDYTDSFDVIQAVKDWIQILIKPAVFFREQAGRTGVLAPFTLSLLYVIAVIAGFMVGGAAISLLAKDVPAIGPIIAGGGIIYFMIFVVPFLYIDSFLFAWIVHGIGCLFGNRAPYSGSYRAVMYAIAPQPILWLLCALVWVVPGMFWLFLMVAFIWAFVLLILAISSTQEISPGAAFGVAALSIIGFFVIQIGLSILLVAVFAAIGMAAGGAAHGMIMLR